MKPAVGYNNAPGLLQILGSIVKGLGNLIFNPDAESSNMQASVDLGNPKLHILPHTLIRLKKKLQPQKKTQS